MSASEANRHRLLITGYTHDGLGIGRINGQVVFVPGALCGEEVIVEICGARKGILRGRLQDILVPHPRRVTPPCPAYASCGGCRFQHVSYSEQLEIKEYLVTEALKRLGGLDGIKVQPVLGMDNPWGYRNKGHFQVGWQEGKAVLGFYEEESHDLIPHHCSRLFSAAVSRLVSGIEGILSEHPLKVYVRDGAGLRWVMIRESSLNGEILVAFIAKGDFSPEMPVIAREICRKFPVVVGVCVNYSYKSQEQLWGGEFKTIIGKKRIEDKLGPFTFLISASSFFQVNNKQAQILYDKALEYAQLSGKENVVDAYCGTGTISLFLAQKARRVWGIEINKEAVEDARKNAERNKIDNVEFLRGEAEKIMPGLVKRGIFPDVVVVDPPRRGCGRQLLESILEVQPRRVVYVSCNPSTLARDLKILAGGGYAVAEVQPVDMFPQTFHVECIVLMSRVEK